MADLYVEGVDDLVTGEAVTLDLPPASLGLHLLSAILDIVISIALLVGGFLLTAALAADDATFGVGAVLTLVVAMLVYPTTIETLTHGRSVGKYATGLRTVRDDAGAISFHHAFVRALVGLAEIWVLSGVPAFICGLVSRKGKRLGDYAAGTYVVRSRVTLVLPPPPPMPPPLAAWARSADIAPLPERLLLAIRQVLGRTESLAPQAQGILLQRLAAETTRFVSPAPPRGTPADAYLAAVIAEHRDRDLARMQREAALVARLTEAARR
ncbi:MAG: RDD family protein [Nocardioidaceae bacterium]|nr:RDD family protein [Nocardioidaceae bacterium]